MNPRFPIFIVSKGRWESRLTARAFERMNISYKIIVEKQEVNKYSSVIDKENIIVLDPKFQKEYNACCTLQNGESVGSGPARNFAWHCAKDMGAEWHWTVDDNIRVFIRLNNNSKIETTDGTIFRCMEDFCLRYSNIVMAGPNYDEFAKRKQKLRPFILNSRIYSCNLIKTSAPFRWRGRYNEDTILSLDMLKAGWCTVLFNAFLQDKGPTMKMKGGNTDELYAKGTLEKSRMLVREHSDVARLVYKFGRWHHYVDYSSFRKNNKLIRKPGLKVKPGVNEYGMKLVKVNDGTKSQADSPKACRGKSRQAAAQ